MTENWLPVVGFEGFYEVSDLGNVRSFGRLKWGGKAYYWVEGRTLVRSVDGRGYLNVNLSGIRKITRTVHSLVADAFLGPRPVGMEVCHNDGNKANPILSNLRYDTKSSNQLDAYKHGTRNNQTDAERARKAVATLDDRYGRQFWVSAMLAGIPYSQIWYDL